MTFGKLRNWYDYVSFLLSFDRLILLEAYLGRGRLMVNLKHDLLMMISLGGAVVSVSHVTSWYIRRSQRRRKLSI